MCEMSRWVRAGLRIEAREESESDMIRNGLKPGDGAEERMCCRQ